MWLFYIENIREALLDVQEAKHLLSRFLAINH